MTFGLLVGTLYATLSVAQDVHLHAMIAAEQRTPPAPPPLVGSGGPRIIDITTRGTAEPGLLWQALGLQLGEEIVAANEQRGHGWFSAITSAAPGSYVDLTVAGQGGREERVLVLVH